MTAKGDDPRAASQLALASCDHRDAPVAEPGETFQGLGHAGVVIGPDGVGVRPGHVPVEEHGREPLESLREAGGALVRDRCDQPVQPPLAQRGEECGFVVRVVLGVREHERVAVRHEHAVDALCDRGEERVRDVGDDEPDRVAGARPHAAGGDVRPILERLHGVEHPPPGSVAHERVVVQDARNGRDGDPRPLCDFLDRRRHGQAVGNDFKRESMRAAAGESRSRQMRSPRAPRVSEATLRAGGSRGRSSCSETVHPARPRARDGGT